MSSLSDMDDLDNIRRRLRVSKLKATRAMIEIERDALEREIVSPATSEDRRDEAFALRDDLMAKWASVVQDLAAARK